MSSPGPLCAPAQAFVRTQQAQMPGGEAPQWAREALEVAGIAI